MLSGKTEQKGTCEDILKQFCFLAECHTDLIRKFYQKTNNKGIKIPGTMCLERVSLIYVRYMYINKYISEESIPDLREHWLHNRNDGEDKTMNQEIGLFLVRISDPHPINA